MIQPRLLLLALIAARPAEICGRIVSFHTFAPMPPSSEDAGDPRLVMSALQAAWEENGWNAPIYSRAESVRQNGHATVHDIGHTKRRDGSYKAAAIFCENRHYTPTWWLPFDVEARRAAYYREMTNIACEFGIPTSLLDATIAQESGYNPAIRSSAGAMGIMQIMPETAQSLGLSNPWHPIENLRAGAHYLRQQIDRFGRVDLALAAYNAGPERRSLGQGDLPAIPETLRYVRTITRNWTRLTQLQQTDSGPLARAAAASLAVRAAGYREVSLTLFQGSEFSGGPD